MSMRGRAYLVAKARKIVEKVDMPDSVYLLCKSPLLISYRVPPGMAGPVAQILRERYLRSNAIKAFDHNEILASGVPGELDEIEGLLRGVLLAEAPYLTERAIRAPNAREAVMYGSRLLSLLLCASPLRTQGQ
jgi:hypothetical protein